MDLDRWHSLLTSRYVCQACTTRLYAAYPTCPACHQPGTVRPLYGFIREYARDDVEYRALIQAGQDPMRLFTDPSPVDLEYTS